jgi:hypothetical protein
MIMIIGANTQGINVSEHHTHTKQPGVIGAGTGVRGAVQAAVAHARAADPPRVAVIGPSDRGVVHAG